MSVSITVLAGRNLVAKKRNGTSDPFVVAKVFGVKDKVKKKKTAVVKKELNPRWNETLEFPVQDVRIQAVHFTVYDKETFTAEFMGQVTVTLKEVALKGGQYDDWLPLDTSHKGEPVSGEIHVRLNLTLPPGQENLFKPAAVPEPVVETPLDPAALQKLLEQEDAFNEGKKAVADCYAVGRELGRGAFAVVKECTHKLTGQKYAIKIIDRGAMGDSNELSLQREIAIMQRVKHPRVIALRSVFQDSKHVYLVMELVTGGELFDKIVERGNYSEADAAELTRLIVEGIAYLHAQGIAHRDLKPENLLLKNKQTATDVKIADFGLSRMIGEQAMMKTACGTPTYVAPEVLTNTGYGPGVDLWSIGVIAYILLCGFPPFYGDTIPEMFEQIMAGKFDFPNEYWGKISPHAKDFINHLLVVDTKKRFTAEQALQHPWLQTKDAPAAALGSQFQRRLQGTVVGRRQESISNAIGGDF